jgi:two-component system chemotaxis response regulator CheB
MNPLRILIVDDTIVYRSILRGVVDALPECTVVGTASDGAMALDRLAQTPADLVLLDVEMPVMDGLQTLSAIRQRFPETGVIMVSGVNQNAAKITIRALQEGALEFIPKPESSNPADSRQALIDQLGRHVEAFRAGARPAASTSPAAAVVAKAAAPMSPAPASAPALVSAPDGKRTSRVDIVAIGVSTGGPNALARVIPMLPGDLNVPIVLVQHMPPFFTQSLAASLNAQSTLTVKEGAMDDLLEPNTVYVAPGGMHMAVRRDANGEIRLGLNENPPENNCRPSVDVLFRSVAVQFSGKVLSVIMTGMGTDGREGVRAIRRQGGLCLAQDEDSCVVYGMPRAVVEAGLVDELITLDALAPRIATLVRTPTLAGRANHG